MSLQPFIEFGTRTMPTGPERLTTRHRGIDVWTQNWQTADPNAFQLGKPPPNHPHMRLTEAEREEDGPVWQWRLNAEGIAGKGPDKTLKLVTDEPEEGWDGGMWEVLTRQPGAARFARGASLPGYANLFVTDRQKEEVGDGLWWMALTTKGAIDAAKTRKRRVDTNEIKVRPSDPNLTTPETQTNGAGFALNANAGTYQNMEVSFANIVVRDTFFKTEKPDTDGIPGNVTPDDAPEVWEFTWSAATVVANWPYQWCLANIQAEQLLNKNLWMVTYVYEYRPRFMPG